MGKAGKRALRQRMSLIDKFEAAAAIEIHEVHSIHEDEERVTVPICPYLTSIITVMVGSPAEQFKVHAGVVCESKVLASKCQGLPPGSYLLLPEVDPSIFELALCHMYGKDYTDYLSPSTPKLSPSDAKASVFRRHSLLYCFARRYELDGLDTLARENIKDLDEVDYESVFLAAKEVYKHLPDDESWFRECFKVETKRALRDNRDLFWEPVILDTIKEEGGTFTVDLFTALMERYEKAISRRIATGPASQCSPQLPRWFSPNSSYGARTHSVKSCSTYLMYEDTNSETESATEATSGDDILRVEEFSCNGDCSPRGESPCVAEITVEHVYATEHTTVEEIPSALEATGAEDVPFHQPDQPEEESSNAVEVISSTPEATDAEQVPFYQTDHLQEELSTAVAEDLVATDEAPNSLPGVETCSGRAQPEYAYSWRTWSVRPFPTSRNGKWNRQTQYISTLDGISAGGATEPECALEERAHVQELLVPVEGVFAEVAPREEESAADAPVEYSVEEEPKVESPADLDIAEQGKDVSDLCTTTPIEEASQDQPAQVSAKWRFEPTFELEPVYGPKSASVPELAYKSEPVCELGPPYEDEPAYEPEPACEPEPAYEPEPPCEPEPPYEPEPPCESEPTCESEPVYEPEPACEPELAREPDPMGNTEEPSVCLPPEPLWGFLHKKSRKKEKKASVAFPTTTREIFQEEDVSETASLPTTDDSSVPAYDVPPADDAAPAEGVHHANEASSPNDASPTGRRYASLPIPTQEPLLKAQGSGARCTKRGFHLARESHWMGCVKCRAEMSEVARKMARECNPGWDVFV